MFVTASPGPNFQNKNCPVQSNLNLETWKKYRPIIDEIDTTLVDNLEFGFCMGIDKNQTISIPYTNHKSAIEKFGVIDEFIVKHYQSKSIAGPYVVNPLPVTVHPSPLQVATSSSGKHRAVIDMSYPAGSSINNAIPSTWSDIPGFSGQFKLPTHEQVCERILDLKDPVMGLTDLKAYYMQLPSDPNDYPYLAFAWRGALWIHLRLPFGARSACLHAQRVTEAVCHVFRRVCQHHVTGYVDDYCSVNERSVARPAHYSLHWLLDDLGLDRTEDKCMLPDDLRVFLGLLYDLRRKLLCLPEEKLHRALDLISDWLARDSVTKPQCESMVGFLNHVATVVVAGKPFNALLYDSLTVDQFPLTLDAEIKQDLTVWRDFLSDSSTRCSAMKRFISAPPDVIVAIAVKRNCCVVRCNGQSYGYNIVSDWLIPKHLMPAVAVWLVVTHHISSIAGQVVCVNVPSKTAQNVINRASTQCNRIRPMLRQSWIRQALADCFVKAVCHGSDNVSWLFSNYVKFQDVQFAY